MQLIIDLPNREETLASNRVRWAEILRDPVWQGHPYRIETNAFGQILMTPPAGGPHSSRQGNLIRELLRRLDWQINPECPISTIDGVRAADVGAYSPERYDTVRGQVAFEAAPEICVEIQSPGDSLQEIRNKFRLYFEAGAIECWCCDREGRMTYYTDNHVETEQERSQLCPDFPNEIRD